MIPRVLVPILYLCEEDKRVSRVGASSIIPYALDSPFAEPVPVVVRRR